MTFSWCTMCGWVTITDLSRCVLRWSLDTPFLTPRLSLHLLPFSWKHGNSFLKLWLVIGPWDHPCDYVSANSVGEHWGSSFWSYINLQGIYMHIRCYILWIVIRYSRKNERNLVDKWPNKGNKCSNLQDQISSFKRDKLQIFLTEIYKTQVFHHQTFRVIEWEIMKAEGTSSVSPARDSRLQVCLDEHLVV